MRVVCISNLSLASQLQAIWKRRSAGNSGLRPEISIRQVAGLAKATSFSNMLFLVRLPSKTQTHIPVCSSKVRLPKSDKASASHSLEARQTTSRDFAQAQCPRITKASAYYHSWYESPGLSAVAQAIPSYCQVRLAKIAYLAS